MTSAGDRYTDTERLIAHGWHLRVDNARQHDETAEDVEAHREDARRQAIAPE